MKFVNAKESYNQSIQIYLEKIEFEQESIGHICWQQFLDDTMSWTNFAHWWFSMQ